MNIGRKVRKCINQTDIYIDFLFTLYIYLYTKGTLSLARSADATPKCRERVNYCQVKFSRKNTNFYHVHVTRSHFEYSSSEINLCKFESAVEKDVGRHGSIRYFLKVIINIESEDPVVMYTAT